MVGPNGHAHIGVGVDLRVEIALALNPWVETRGETVPPVSSRLGSGR
jgi:hypothetical protein